MTIKVVGPVVPVFQTSNEILGPGQIPQRSQVGIKSAEVECEKCGRVWVASARDGRNWMPTNGGVLVSCTCGNNGLVTD